MKNDKSKGEGQKWNGPRVGKDEDTRADFT